MRYKIFSLLFFFITSSFIINSQNWIQLGEDLNGEAKNDYFGISVSINSDGKIIACGADGNDINGKNSGVVRIFEFSDDKWKQLGKDICGENPGDNFGTSICLNSDGSIFAASAPKYNNKGNVRIFRYNNGNWVQLGKDIKGDAKRKHFGNSISLSSDGFTVAIGTMWDNRNGNNSGTVKVFKYIDDNWEQVGKEIVGIHNGDLCGATVSLSSDASIIAVSSPCSSENNTYTGQVRIFKNLNNEWIQIGSGINGLKFKDRDAFISLGSEGKTVAVGSVDSDENGLNAGKVRIFKFISNEWIQLGNSIYGNAPGDWAGRSVSLNPSGNILAVGAVSNDGNGANSGQVRIFELINNKWIQMGEDIYGESAGDMSGISIKLSNNGSIIIIGAIGNEGNGTGGGHVRVYKYRE